MTDKHPHDLIVREDVSEVPAQGAYLAKRCPARVAFDVAPPEDARRVEDTPADEARQQAGVDFEARVFDVLEVHYGDRLVNLERYNADRSASAEHEQATHEAMLAGAEVIVGGRLPIDDAGKRVGKPDVLVRGGRRPDGRWGYLPVDVKNHRTIATASTSAFQTLVGSELPDIAIHPGAIAAHPTDKPRRTGRISDDLHQLAHYWRMLEACGLEDASEGAWGAVIGSDEICTWYRLDDPLWITWRSAAEKKWSTLERYDYEFGFRLDVYSRAAAGREPEVVPAYVDRLCSVCHWREYCEEEMERRDEVTLLPGVDWNRRVRLHSVGLATRSDIAELDQPAAVVADIPRADRVLDAAATADDPTPLEELATRKDQRKTIADLSVRTVGDLRTLDERTLGVVAELQDFTGLSKLVCQARADLRQQVFLRPEMDRLDVPRADVEFDFDIESYEQQVYLWGVRIDDPHGVLGPPGSRFVPDFFESSWPFDATALFERFWSWFHSSLEAVRDSGRTFAVYSWSGVEGRSLQNGAAESGREAIVEQVRALIADPAVWVDLEALIKRQLVLPLRGRTGLKVVAPLAGFEGWQRVKDEHGLDALDGDESTALFGRAAGINEAADPHAAAALLAYNEADVDATWHVREWLTGMAAALRPELSADR